MVELKFKDTDSLSAITGSLHKNGHQHSNFIVCKNENGGIDYFDVRIECIENG